MVIEQHNLFFGNKLFRQAAGSLCLVVFLTISPARGFAQCEANGYAMSNAAVPIASDETTDVNNMVTALKAAWTVDLNNLRTELGGQDQADSNSMFTALNTFWRRWQDALKATTAQLSAGTQDQSRQLGSINDASNVLAAAEDEQQERLKSTFQYQPTDQACRFDTAAEYLAEDEQTSAALAQGFEWDFVSLANNEFGPAAQYTPAQLQAAVAATGSYPPGMAQNGPEELQNERWTLYTQNFCDYLAEDCNAGCAPPSAGACTSSNPPPPSYYADIDVLPSKMLFSKYTINLSNPIALTAMDSMMFNVTGYDVPEPIVSGALGTVAGIEQMFVRREYMAQMSAAGSLLYAVAADRAPGKPAPSIQLMRETMGAQDTNAADTLYASRNPSVREIRQSIIEQLWDPNFYKNLGDNPSTMAEKELYLKAYGLVMLNDMISKQEKISTAYAVETAALLETLQHNRAGFTAHAPVQ